MPPPCVLHVAAIEDEEALENLCRTTPIVAAAGAEQVVLAIGEGGGNELAWAAWNAAVAAEIRRLSFAKLSVLGKIRVLQEEFSRLAREKTLHAVHLHGIGPCLLGSRALGGGPLLARVLCSPYGWSLASPLGSALLGRLLQRQLSPLNYAGVAASPPEAEALSKLLNRSADLLPQPVSDVFFAVSRQEDVRPNVLADGHGAEAVNLVTRLCVLLNGRAPRVRFSWLGQVERSARGALEAANVELVRVADDAERAQLLAGASAFLHISVRSGMPLAVPQAMAAGVPCLVADTPPHRALVRHGETGFICTSERDYLDKIVLLLRDRTERIRIGAAARAEAERCFTSRQFERAILRAYGFSRIASALEPAAVRAVGNGEGNGERTTWNRFGR